MNTINFVTKNRDKVNELREILGTKIEINHLDPDEDIREIQGSSCEIAINKAKRMAKKTGSKILIEDTSFFISELNQPGPYVKEWSNKELFKASIGCEDKSVYAVCIFAYCEPGDNEPILFEGRCDGIICNPEIGAGEYGFGWDPVFYVSEKQKSFAQMEPSEKNKISHRYRAIEKMKDYFIK